MEREVCLVDGSFLGLVPPVVGHHNEFAAILRGVGERIVFFEIPTSCPHVGMAIEI